MKKHAIALSILLVLLSLPVIISCSEQTTFNNTSNATDVYEFSVRPGMPEWASFTSHTEMVEACQIPESILQDMSTAGLVETVLNYPLAIDIWAFGSTQTGFGAIIYEFNGIRELLSREDAATELIKKYCSLDITIVNESWALGSIAEFTLGKVAFIEIILAQDEIISKMTEGEKRELIAEALAKYDQKGQHSDVYGAIDQMYTMWIMARVLYQENYAPFMQKVEESEELQYFIDGGTSICFDVSDEIISAAQEFLSQAQ